MHVIARRTLVDFYAKHDEAQGHLEAGWHETKRADWSCPEDIKKRYHTASFLAGNRVVFNIGGNRYRLIVKINYPTKTVFIRFVGTHSEYNRINAEDI